MNKLSEEELIKILEELKKDNYIKSGWLDNLDFIITEYSYKKKVNGKFEYQKSNIYECINDCKSPTGKDETEKIKTIFKAFSLFPMKETKILIIGQDPYPDKDKAEGLAFSVKEDYPKIDASLLNIFKAIDEYAGKKQRNQSLIDWARTNKVLLLNTALTYEADSQKNKHQIVWNHFIKNIITKLLTCNNENNKKLVVFLWGDDAQKIFFECTNSFGINNCFRNLANISSGKRKTETIAKELLCLTTSHPSPLGVWRGFKDDAPDHFKACDEFLKEEIWKNFPESNK